MKKFISRIVVMIAIAISFSVSADAQLTIKIRPIAPHRVRPMPPSPKHVWVNGEWNVNSGHYAYTDGYWSEPRGRYHRHSEGHWKKTRHGWIWVPGGWRR